MASLNDIIVRLRVDDKDVDVTLNDFSKQLKDVEKTGKQSGKSLGDMFGSMKAGYLAAAAAVAGIISVLNSAKNASRDLAETQSKVQTLFGEDKKIEEWAQGASDAMGLSKRAALDALGTMGNMFLQLGASRDKARDLSTSMVQLSADLASFHNVAGGAEEVSLAMQSAFRGEYDALQRYIPTINAAAVEKEALAMTTKKNVKELTNLEKSLAVQKIIMKDAGAATGDFARTADQAANSERRVEAKLEDLLATLGDIFMPVYQDFLNVSVKLIEALKGVVGWVDAMSQKIIGSARAMNEFRKQVEGLKKSELTEKLTDITAQMKALEDKMINTNITDWKNQLVMAFGTVSGNLEMAAGKFGKLQNEYLELQEMQAILTEQMKKYGGEIENVNTNLNNQTTAAKEAFTVTYDSYIKSGEAFEEYKRSMEQFYGEDLFLLWETRDETERELAEAALEMKYEMGLLDYEQYSQFLNDKLAVAAMVYGKDNAEYLKWLKKRQTADQNYYQAKRVLTTRDRLDTIANLASIVQNATAQNKKNFAIQKRASQVIAVMDTIEGAQKAFNSMAEIPIVGTVLGTIAAAAALAAGYARVRSIEAQQFYRGGYTGSGGKYEPAGTVHRGEVVFSQSDVAAWGGPGNVEKLRTRSYASGGVVDGMLQDTTPNLALLNEFQGLRNDLQNLTLSADFDEEQVAIRANRGNKNLARRTT